MSKRIEGRLMMALPILLLAFVVTAIPAVATAGELVACEVLQSDDSVRIEITANGEWTHRSFRVDDPERFVLDLVGVEVGNVSNRIEADGRFEVAVLGDGEWVSVPLLARGEATTLSTLPAVADAVLAVDGEHLSLVTRRRGIYRFAVSFRQRARTEGRRRTAVVDCGEATLARLLLHLDPGLFRLASAVAAERGDGVWIHPEDGRFTVSWERIAELPRPSSGAAERPPIAADSGVPRTRRAASLLLLTAINSTPGRWVRSQFLHCDSDCSWE